MTGFAVGTVVTFATRVGSVHAYHPKGVGEWSGPTYAVISFRLAHPDRHGMIEHYPASMVDEAPLDWAPVVGCPELTQRWSRDPQGGYWQREVRRDPSAPRVTWNVGVELVHGLGGRSEPLASAGGVSGDDLRDVVRSIALDQRPDVDRDVLQRAVEKAVLGGTVMFKLHDDRAAVVTNYCRITCRATPVDRPA